MLGIAPGERTGGAGIAHGLRKVSALPKPGAHIIIKDFSVVLPFSTTGNELAARDRKD